MRHFFTFVVSATMAALSLLGCSSDDDSGGSNNAGSGGSAPTQCVGINAEFDAIRPDRRLPRQVEQELWRIFQEALTNVERHADASTVHVTWDCSDHNARLLVADNGAGMDPARPNPERYGLVGIRERADAIGARVRFESALGAGTTVSIELEATS